MRTELGKYNGKRLRFQAVVGRFGSKKSFKGWPEKTILLHNIMVVGTAYYVTDHLWFTVRKTLDSLNLQPGEVIRFDARVNTYMKGYRGEKELDYKLTHPTNFARNSITPEPSSQLALF